MCVKGGGVLKLQHMISDPKYVVLLRSMPTDTPITSARAVIGSSKKGELINIGNSVEFCSGSNEVLLMNLMC